ncbi:hypothetical protein ACTFIR_000645 [Dictyostelium discoideum]
MIETENSSKTMFQQRTKLEQKLVKKRKEDKEKNNEKVSIESSTSKTTSTFKVKKGGFDDDDRKSIGEPPHSPSLERFSSTSKPRESILTTPQTDIGWGTFNYIAICYCMAGFSMMADTYIEKGTLVDFELFWWLVTNYQVFVVVSIGLAAWSFFNYFCTCLVVRDKIPNSVSIFLYVFWQFICFSLSISYVMAHEMSPILSGGTGLQICVFSLKNHSYWHTNYFLAKGIKKAKADKTPIIRKDLTPNIGFNHFLYFMIAPTLVFETQFPRTKSIRYSYILKETLAATGAFLMFYVVLCKTGPIYKQIDSLPLIILLLKLSLPSMSLWMLGFYGVFHCLLNIFAEVTRYADREFYQDWWNATTFDMWWRKWNRPVHKWMLRHVYRDSMHTVKLNKFGALFSTFLLSALLHEFVMIISFRFIRPILSTTMLLQIGLVNFTQLDMLQKTRFGNVVMWITVFVGQPLVQLLYSTQYSALVWNNSQ